MLKKTIFVSLFLLTQLISQEHNSTFTDHNFYVGAGWKTFQIGQLNDAKNTLVNGDGVLFIAGMYFPKYDLKVELSASVLGYLSYKEYDGTGFVIDYNTEIEEADYAVSVAYGAGQRNDKLYSFPFLYLGAGAKVISYDDTSFGVPMVQAGVGFSVRYEPIEFFVKYYYDFLFDTQDFTTASGDTIEMQSLNGSLEAGFNYLF